jgi:hypothetical protein
MKWTYIGDQGEVSIYIAQGALPPGLEPHAPVDKQGRPIIAHSESGNHHVLERPVKVYAQPGMDTLYALLEQPTALIQDAPNPHGQHSLPACIAKFVINQEYDPWSEEIRRVAD